MSKNVIFFHGGGSREDFKADEKLVVSLLSELGVDYSVHYHYLPNNGTPDLGRREQIGKEISASADGVILVAHSLGASMLLAYVSENEVEKQIEGIFLLATPFWEGKEDWVNAFKLQSDFATRIDKNVPLFFYHCKDDEEVAFSHFEIYKQNLPHATFREVQTGGHQFSDGLKVVAADVKEL
ncbi:hypothetical protein DYBT9623_01765 [Dyadobacter sp. CECT 9623]|uniref:Alpha/beta hydrolase n=1 Tax=Dyadobacter linearis TaxID=2823330 RepID=A0ABM8UNF2_9BACT|nr:alpha/beta hydrolase [Dyadobacter sp. CECT 9623]CAG5069031.1 hypothetical protein DYBT9623_01765 [Dyadobacter sp. CECT 9623]